MNRRALIVTSAYAPALTADMHRARQLAWELPDLGWDVDVLAPGVGFQRADSIDGDSLPLFNPRTRVHAVAPVADRWLRALGIGNIGWRSLGPMLREGHRLIRERRHDLVYITTAQFPLFTLGPLWKARHGVPYVLDFHDPWVRQESGVATRDYSIKRRLGGWAARILERRAVQGANGVVAVSPAYLDDLRNRYGALPALSEGRTLAVPFGGLPAECAAPPPRLDRKHREIVYVGAGGALMRRSFETICRALAQTDPVLRRDLRIRLYGTDSGWRAGAPKPLQDLAVRMGLGDLVEENPERIPYTRALKLARESDGLLVLGVDEPAYAPSKLLTYALTGLPLLACLRADSAAARIFRSSGSAGHLLGFGTAAESPAVPIVSRFLEEVRGGARFDRTAGLQSLLARGMAQRHAALFEHVLDAPR